ncbi:xaa-Pro aminopeptidase ApepP-like [Saccostrea echinata]|uniref:xaa-Pro aminopeptidase ApepP-like n=1 Tax=Saccostrea echinata TaxID=191078 RepID=UPI002A838D2E|nr:xaa-Pro aminopeptidase ApepP-like [Saccostrea echinata]
MLFFNFLILGLVSSHADAVQNLHAEDIHYRTKRDLSRSRRSEIRNLSPDDRASCSPGQSVPPNRINTTERLSDLRTEMNRLGLQAYIIPSEDAHQSEYTSPYDKRRKFISGLSGSAGYAIVTKMQAALWTDARYFLQAEDEMDCNWILMKWGETGVPSATEWLVSVLENTPNAKVGAYPFFLGSKKWESYEEKLSEENITMTKTDEDLIDKIWTTGRPQEPNSPINALPYKFSGRNWQDKIADIYKAMEEKKVDSMIVSSLDETAWLLNLRAEDILYSPFFLSYIIVDRKKNQITLYIKDHIKKLTQAPTDPETTQKLHEHLNTGSTGSCSGQTGYCVVVLEYEPMALINKMRSVVTNSEKVWISPYCSYAIFSVVPKEKRIQENTPVSLQKAEKNEVERNGMIKSHIRDAVALISFIAKLEKEVKEGKKWTELSAAEDLAKFRGRQQYNRGLSFDTISSSGSNGAVIHYTPSNLTDKEITTTEMYLLDSGGQYLDGTTDVTRTFHFGTPTDFQKECYTRVLMGSVDLARVKILKSSIGPHGQELDILARRPLWDVGLHYKHGSGHGIGMYLGVHEYPPSIGMTGRSISSHDAPIKEGQFFSDEPGYYEDGSFGVRIESILMVKKVELKYKFSDSEFLEFETITLVPFEPNLIEYDMLSRDQIDWINSFHEKVQKTIGPILMNSDREAYDWLERRTKSITRQTSTSSGVNISASSFLLMISAVLVCISQVPVSEFV